jgi:hypothetical protein
MLEPPRLGLRVVGPEDLDGVRRECLRPGEPVIDRYGAERRLPSYFFEVPSWDAALDIKLAPNFGLWELIEVDVREAEPMRLFPRYVPCAIALLAGQLQLLRSEVGRVVRIAANGGYRSPAHGLARDLPTHCWGSAANIYRIGDEWLDTRARVEKYAEISRRVLSTAWMQPYGDMPGEAFDHLHIDLGYATLEPHTDEATASREGASTPEN